MDWFKNKIYSMKRNWHGWPTMYTFNCAFPNILYQAKDPKWLPLTMVLCKAPATYFFIVKLGAYPTKFLFHGS